MRPPCSAVFPGRGGDPGWEPHELLVDVSSLGAAVARRACPFVGFPSSQGRQKARWAISLISGRGSVLCGFANRFGSVGPGRGGPGHSDAGERMPFVWAVRAGPSFEPSVWAVWELGRHPCWPLRPACRLGSGGGSGPGPVSRCSFTEGLAAGRRCRRGGNAALGRCWLPGPRGWSRGLDGASDPGWVPSCDCGRALGESVQADTPKVDLVLSGA